MRHLFTLLSLPLLLVGCPDPSVQSSSGPGGAGAPSQGGPGPGPGAAGAGGPGGGQMRPENATFKVEAGQGVTVSGTLEYAGSKTGVIRLDFLRKSNNALDLAHTMTLDAPGPWSVEAPKGLGELYIVGFIDEKSDGPSAEDPAGKPEGTLTVGDAAITDVKITLTDDADLGELEPGKGGAPPGAKGGGAPGGGPAGAQGAGPGGGPGGAQGAGPGGAPGGPASPPQPEGAKAGE